jgi:putative transcriptional regulator
MNVHHHLDEATLVRYAAGNLDEAFSLVVASHLAMCSTCLAGLRDAEQTGGALLESIEAVPLRNGSFELMMEKLEKGAVPAPAAEPIFTPQRDSEVPVPLQRLVGERLDDIKWRTIAPGVRKHNLPLKRRDGSSLYMLNIAPGMAVPEHGHGGAEITLILSGAYRDDMGLFGPGDVADLDEHVEHQPKVEPGAPCICLVATERPTRFKDFFSRLLQPLTGI